MDARRRNSVSTVLKLALVTGVLVAATDSGLAQEKKKVSWSTKPENTKITVQQALEIPDTAVMSCGSPNTGEAGLMAAGRWWRDIRSSKKLLAVSPT
jgi:hypothetical protein